MYSKEQQRIIAISIMIITGIFLTVGQSMAQLTCQANASANIMTPDDISALSLASDDGTRFMLKTGANNCFDITVDGLKSTLEGIDGKEKVSYSLRLEQWPSAPLDIINIRLNVIFADHVKNGTYQATNPYSISVNYN
jgi:hypothetical protein